FSAEDPSRTWELRANQEFVCKLPCTRWVTPAETFQIRSDGGPVPETIDITELRSMAGGGHAGDVDVRTYPRDTGLMVGGITTAALGGMAIFFGGFFALMGGVGDEPGLTTTGGVAAALGAVAIAPGVWMIVESAPRTEVTQLGGPAPGAVPTLRGAF